MKHTQSTFVILASCLFLLLSCQSSKELHYFKEGNNYYRLKVKQHAFLSSSRYVSGYFDPEAIDQFFGETTRPDSAHLARKSKVVGVDACGEEILGDLVLVLSTNADAVTKEIGGITENDALLSMITGLATKNKVKEALVIQEEINKLLHKITNDLAQTEVLETNLLSNKTNEQVKNSLTKHLNSKAIQEGRLSGIKELKDIEPWLLDGLK
jgi:hypothetical protein